MSTFALIHGGGDVGWSWHMVEAELRASGHDVVAPDLPCEDESAGLNEYADAVVDALLREGPVDALLREDPADAAGGRRDLVVVGHSLGGFTAPLVADRLPTDLLVFVAGMIPAPGEPPGQWVDNTGFSDAVREQAARDGGLTGNPDPYVSFYHDVARVLAEEAMSKERRQSDAMDHTPWPLDAWPPAPSRFVLCTQDRFFPADFMRRQVAERLHIVPDEIEAGHCVALSRPKELAHMLDGFTRPGEALG